MRLHVRLGVLPGLLGLESAPELGVTRRCGAALGLRAGGVRHARKGVVDIGQKEGVNVPAGLQVGGVAGRSRLGRKVAEEDGEPPDR